MKNKKKYNPFKMWGSYFGLFFGCIFGIINNNWENCKNFISPTGTTYYSFWKDTSFCPLNPNSIVFTPINFLDKIGMINVNNNLSYLIIILIYATLGFLLGWGIHSLVRALRK
jgi:hypothetical protein